MLAQDILFTVVYILTYSLDNCAGRDHSVRTTKYGKVKGIVDKIHGHQKIEKFLGIPYARAPVGNLRLEPPVPPEPWGTVIKNATEIPPACPQPTEGVAYIEYHVPGFNRTSEDCLFLNIYLPKGAHRSMPVLVFIHGGSYQNGMGAMFDGSAIASRGIVVVTFNYRLGPLGFLSAADDVIRGNYGMLDMVQALRWIQENIVYFRGDPSRVTIDGHSAGGCSVGLLLLSPLAKGLFHQVIQQSGSPLAHWSVARHERRPNFFYKNFVSSAKCYRNSTTDIKQCLKNLDSTTLERIVMNEYEWSTSLVPQYRPVIDGHFLPQTPEELLKSGHVNANNFFTGATMDEGLIAAMPLIKLFGVAQSGVRKLLSIMRCFRGDLPDITGIVDTVIDQYVDWTNGNFREDAIERAFSQIVGDYFITAPTHLMAEMLTRINVTVYLYNFEYKSILGQWDGVIHGAELFYLSGCPFTGHKNFRYDRTDRDVATALILLWSNFIKYGTPSLAPRDNTYLPPFDEDRKFYTRIHAQSGYPVLSNASGLRPDKMSFWNEKVPEMYRKQVRYRNEYTFPSDYDDGAYMTVKTGANEWILISVCICLSVLTLVLTIGYYRLRQRVVKLLRQLSVPPGVRML